MAGVVLLSATPASDLSDFHLAPVRDLRASAEIDRFKLHSLTLDPESADIIIFAEAYGAGWYFEQVRRHPYVRRYREKCFLFCSNPFVIPFLPGVFSSVGKGWSSSRTRPGFYIGFPQNEFTTFTPPAHDLPYLYGFMGSIKNAPVRRQLAQLRHQRGFFKDTAEEFDRILHRKMNARERRDYYRRYAELTKATKFILCPRGLSVSSIRLFETMRMGRVPVILSDEWAAPVGPCWERFAIRVREKDFASIPGRLEKREAEAVEMGMLARQQWEEWFADDVVFHRIVDLCLQMKRERRIPESVARWPVYLQYLRPFHLRRLVGAAFRGAVRSVRTSPAREESA